MKNVATISLIDWKLVVVDASELIASNRARANRLNASRSTGSVTPGGKAISARNATTHGLAAAPPPTPLEDRSHSALMRLQQVHRLKDDMISRVLMALGDSSPQREAVGPLLKLLTAIDRYERRARAQCLRAIQSQ